MTCVQNEMKTFFRRYYTHNRWVSATQEPLDALQLDTAQGALPVELNDLYLDMRPFMNRCDGLALKHQIETVLLRACS